ncbi:hypothetical protein TcWFU_000109 [Taenia crassiceps]|uniref:Uncharacterized protein n=1 Tax=Taenia crassiceps TaxID=6207 RepID=A0ABR4QJA8_9CEST
MTGEQMASYKSEAKWLDNPSVRTQICVISSVSPPYSSRLVKRRQGECPLTRADVVGRPVVVGGLAWSRTSPLIAWSEDNRDARVALLQVPTPLIRISVAEAAVYLSRQ